MNKKERVIAAIRHESVDYVPCGFSLHFPHDKAYGEAGVKSHLDFFKETDTDIIKIMNENLVPYVGELTSPAEYERLVRGFSMKSDFMQAQVDFTKAILDKADSTAFSIGTLHGVTASSIHPIEKMGISYDKTREILVEYLREDPVKMQSAMQRITDVMCDLARTYIELGVDGVYYAALGAEKRYFTDEEFEKWIAPMDKQILTAIKEASIWSAMPPIPTSAMLPTGAYMQLRIRLRRAGSSSRARRSWEVSLTGMVSSSMERMRRSRRLSRILSDHLERLVSYSVLTARWQPSRICISCQ